MVLISLRLTWCLLQSDIWIICWFLAGEEPSGTGGRTYSVSEVSRALFSFDPPVRYSGEDDSILAFRLKTPTRTNQTTYTRVWFCRSVFKASYCICWDTWWRGWLRNCATSPKIAGSIPVGVTGIFHWHIPSGHTMTLGSTQPLKSAIHSLSVKLSDFTVWLHAWREKLSKLRSFDRQ